MRKRNFNGPLAVILAALLAISCYPLTRIDRAYAGEVLCSEPIRAYQQECPGIGQVGERSDYSGLLRSAEAEAEEAASTPKRFDLACSNRPIIARGLLSEGAYYLVDTLIRAGADKAYAGRSFEGGQSPDGSGGGFTGGEGSGGGFGFSAEVDNWRDFLQVVIMTYYGGRNKVPDGMLVNLSDSQLEKAIDILYGMEVANISSLLVDGLFNDNGLSWGQSIANVSTSTLSVLRVMSGTLSETKTAVSNVSSAVYEVKDWMSLFLLPKIDGVTSAVNSLYARLGTSNTYLQSISSTEGQTNSLVSKGFSDVIAAIAANVGSEGLAVPGTISQRVDDYGTRWIYFVPSPRIVNVYDSGYYNIETGELQSVSGEICPYDWGYMDGAPICGYVAFDDPITGEYREWYSDPVIIGVDSSGSSEVDTSMMEYWLQSISNTEGQTNSLVSKGFADVLKAVDLTQVKTSLGAISNVLSQDNALMSQGFADVIAALGNMGVSSSSDSGYGIVETVADVDLSGYPSNYTLHPLYPSYGDAGYCTWYTGSAEIEADMGIDTASLGVEEGMRVWLKVSDSSGDHWVCHVVGSSSQWYPALQYLGEVSAVGSQTNALLSKGLADILAAIPSGSSDGSSSVEVDMSGVESRLDDIKFMLGAAGVVENGKDVLDAIFGDMSLDATETASAAVGSAIQNAFPFCVPAVLKQILGLLQADPAPPEFHFDFWGAPLDFGFEDWGGLADMTGWLSRIGFAVMLFANSRRFVFAGGVGGD